KMKTLTPTIVLLMLLFFGSCRNAAGTSENIADARQQENEQLSDDELLDLVQRQTLKYFWDYAEPNSGMARERFHPDGNYPRNDEHVVTTGGSGFGLMALVVGMERNFIPRDSAVTRLDRIADFLNETPRFHGVWPHWINGETGETQAFSKKDNGGDLVETSFLAQGFLVVREYLKDGNSEEKAVAQIYDELWKSIEWNWYTNNKNGLY